MSAQTCEEFLERFVLPLVTGGEMHVREPIDMPLFEDFVRDIPHASTPLVKVDEARDAVLASVVVHPPPFVLDVDELSLAAAVHNLLYLAHPDAARWNVSKKVRNKVIATAQHFAARPRTRNRRTILARHGLLHNLFRIARNDIKISWWTGSATFLGQEAPRRLTRWQGIRRVEETMTTTGFSHLFLGADVAAVIGTLIRRSPLSQLLCKSPEGPHLHWEDTLFVLRDPELARAVCYQALVGVGEQSSRQSVLKSLAKSPARFAASLEQMLERSPREHDLRTVLAFLMHLNGLFVMRELELGEKSLMFGRVLNASRRPRGLASFMALPNALAKIAPELASPPGLRNVPELYARWQQHRFQTQELLGDGLIDGLADRLRRHLCPDLLLPEGAGRENPVNGLDDIEAAG